MITVSYDDFTEAFLAKITEYTFVLMEDANKDSIVDGYLKRAAMQFNDINNIGFNNYDDTAREFELNIVEGQLDRVVDIVSNGMLVQWMYPYVFRQENLEHLMSTADYKAYSPAEFLLRIRESYDKCKKDFLQDTREYSYAHGDLTDLHL